MSTFADSTPSQRLRWATLDHMEPQSARTAVVAVDDVNLRDEVRRSAAAADCVLDETAGEPARSAWVRAQTIVLDCVAAQRCMRAGLPRRPGVVVVCDGEPTLAVWQSASAVGAETVLALPNDTASLVELLGADAEVEAGDGIVVSVIGGTGGAGASTFAAALAIAAETEAFRPSTLLVDGDSAGGGIDLLVGVERRSGLRWPGLILEGGRVSAAALHSALPTTDGGTAVLSCGRGVSASDPSATAMRAVLDAARGAGDFVACDVPRQRDGATDVLLEAADLVVLVVPATLRASAAAEAIADYVKERNTNQGLIVRGPAPGGLRGIDIADALGLPLLAAMRAEPRLDEAVDAGGLRLRRRGPLRDATRAVLDVLASRPAARRWVA